MGANNCCRSAVESGGFDWISYKGLFSLEGVMMDIYTIIGTALALGALSGLQETATQVVKDAYASVKDFLKQHYSKIDLDMLEQNPTSEARKQVLVEDLQTNQVADNKQLLERINQLLKALEDKSLQGTPIGVTLDQIKGMTLEIEDVISSGSGVSVTDSEIDDIKIKGIRAGGSPRPN